MLKNEVALAASRSGESGSAWMEKVISNALLNIQTSKD